MISFDGFIMEPGVPIYMQIISYIKKGAASGAVADGDELPSRRVLSALLGVNPNTVQKAYKILEDEDLIRSHPGAGSRIVLDSIRRESIKAELLETEIRSAVASLKMLGLEKSSALELMEKYWE